MEEKRFLKAKDIAEIMRCSEATAYRIIRKLNAELQEIGKITISGKISRRYFEEKCYY